MTESEALRAVVFFISLFYFFKYTRMLSVDWLFNAIVIIIAIGQRLISLNLNTAMRRLLGYTSTFRRSELDILCIEAVHPISIPQSRAFSPKLTSTIII